MVALHLAISHLLDTFFHGTAAPPFYGSAAYAPAIASIVAMWEGPPDITKIANEPETAEIPAGGSRLYRLNSLIQALLASKLPSLTQ